MKITFKKKAKKKKQKNKTKTEAMPRFQWMNKSLSSPVNQCLWSCTCVSNYGACCVAQIDRKQRHGSLSWSPVHSISAFPQLGECQHKGNTYFRVVGWKSMFTPVPNQQLKTSYSLWADGEYTCKFDKFGPALQYIITHVCSQMNLEKRPEVGT